MAQRGYGFFDRRGNFFKSGHEATVSDLAALLGQIGDGESLAPGIAHKMLEKRAEIEELFAEHDRMMIEDATSDGGMNEGKVTKLKQPTG